MRTARVPRRLARPGPDHAALAREAARRWLAERPLIVHCLGTRPGPAGECCEVAVLDSDGLPVVDTLIAPRGPIQRAATAAHGIADAHIDGAPTLAEVLARSGPRLTSRALVGYDLPFHLACLERGARAWGLALPRAPRRLCLRRLYAGFRGERGPLGRGFRRHALPEAARQCGIPIPSAAHRARAAAELALELLLHVAA
jgi:DNA polymerase III epsilon subunit-like protein